MSRRLRRVDAMRPVPSPRSGAVLAAIGRRMPASMRRNAADTVLGTKAIAATLGAAGGLLMSSGTRAAFSAAILAAGGWRWPELRAARRSEARRRRVLDALPDVLDLLAACVRAGSSVERALVIAAGREHGPLGDAMRAAVGALEHGIAKDEAYRILRDRAGVPEVGAVVAALRRAERLGTSLAGTLDALSADMRDRRRARAEERARAAPVRMLFPVVVCFLPAFVILTIAPVLIVAVRGFRGT